MSYRAVLTDPGEGRAALLRLWTHNLPVRGDAAAKLAWGDLDAPTGPAQAFLLHGDDGEVGCAGVTVRELWYRERPLRTALLADYVRVLRHGGYLARRYDRPVVGHAAGIVVDAAKLAVRAARTLGPLRASALRWLPPHARTRALRTRSPTSSRADGTPPSTP